MGNAAIRERALSLSKDDELVLLSIDGLTEVGELERDLKDDELSSFRGSISHLCQLELIELVPPSGFDPVVAVSGSPDLDEFFSSSLHPVGGGSGLVVDTKANTMKTMRDKRGVVDADSSVDFLIPLDGVGTAGAEKKRLQKLVEVYPNPSKSRKKKKRQVETRPEKKWMVWVYVGVMVMGLLAVIFALMFG